MKKCKRCNGTGRKPNKSKPKLGWKSWYSSSEAVNVPCPYCYGKGTK